MTATPPPDHQCGPVSVGGPDHCGLCARPFPPEEIAAYERGCAAGRREAGALIIGHAKVKQGLYLTLSEHAAAQGVPRHVLGRLGELSTEVETLWTAARLIDPVLWSTEARKDWLERLNPPTDQGGTP